MTYCNRLSALTDLALAYLVFLRQINAYRVANLTIDLIGLINIIGIIHRIIHSIIHLNQT